MVWDDMALLKRAIETSSGARMAKISMPLRRSRVEENLIRWDGVI